MDVRNPDGAVAASASTLPKGFAKVTVPVPPASAGKTWSLVVKPAEKGISEDLRLTLGENLPPYLALAPSSLLVPTD